MWDSVNNKEIETPEEIKEFLDAIEKVYKKYNLSISHEDGHGAFQIERYNRNNVDWLKEAHKAYK